MASILWRRSAPSPAGEEFTRLLTDFPSSSSETSSISIASDLSTSITSCIARIIGKLFPSYLRRKIEDESILPLLQPSTQPSSPELSNDNNASTGHGAADPTRNVPSRPRRIVSSTISVLQFCAVSMFHVFRRLGNRIHDQILYYIRIFQVRNKIYTLLRTPAANYKFTPEAIAELRSLTQTYSNLRQGRLWRTWKLNKQFRFICCTCRRGYDTAPWSQTEAEEIERVCGKCRSGEQRTRRRRRVVRRVWNDDERWEMYKEVEWEVWKRRWRRAGRGILAKVGIREDVWTWIEAVIIGRL